MDWNLWIQSDELGKLAIELFPSVCVDVNFRSLSLRLQD